MNLKQVTLDDLLQEKSFSAIIGAQNRAEVPGIDVSQWSAQLKAVYQVMRDGRWRSLAEIAFQAKAPEASASARIRDLANLKGIPHERRKAREGKLYEYRIILKPS